MPRFAELLCGAPTKNGPCTLPKGHKIGYHRHRVYKQMTWIIEDPTGAELDSGLGRIPMNYAITEALKENPIITINVKQWDDRSDISIINVPAA